MKFFKKIPPTPPLTELKEIHKSGVEIVAHRDATKEAKKEVDEANAKLNRIFGDNHFSLTIYLTTGGKIKQKGNA